MIAKFARIALNRGETRCWLVAAGTALKQRSVGEWLFLGINAQIAYCFIVNSQKARSVKVAFLAALLLGAVNVFGQNLETTIAANFGYNPFTWKPHLEHGSEPAEGCFRQN